uniref:Reverse transcriptase domain-containing protein n=1 Tax=Cajanus cajan TaxID=3821 RepID=A0A151TPL1_CAJCA|nr:hypothetical protein KK1_022617 [Cajanus cajan]
MGFLRMWRNWIAECLRITFVSILVNVSSTKEFGVGRGSRKGNPLSHFLFIIMAKGLNDLM